jgi:hypothetical protein
LVGVEGAFTREVVGQFVGASRALVDTMVRLLVKLLMICLSEQQELLPDSMMR